jgi:hypothetical protein
MYRFVFAFLAMIAACETGGKGYSTTSKGPATGYDVVEVRQFGRGCTAGDPVEEMLPMDGGIVTAVVGVSVAAATDERGGYDMIDPLTDWTATTDGFLIVTCPETVPATVAYVAYVAVAL